MTTGDDASGPSGHTEQWESAPRQEPLKPDQLQVENPSSPLPDGMSSQRVFKKVSPNQKLTLYLSSRDLVVSAGGIDKLQGVLLVDPEFVEDRRVFGQVTLTFRYGREDEEVMGLKFCNEAIMCLAQLYPPYPAQMEGITPLQEALIRRLGPNAYPFSLEITPLAPPSVQLVPAKEYNGAPIGTSYDVRAYVDKADEKLHRRSTVRMGIRVVQRAFAPPSPNLYVPGGTGKTCREKAKLHRKTLLFGCKSVPVQIKNPTIDNDQVISRSAETVANTETSINDKNWLHVQKAGVFADPTIFQNTTNLTVPSPILPQVRRKSILKLGDNSDDERCNSPARVSFEGENMVNGNNTQGDKHSHDEDKKEDRNGDNETERTEEEDRQIAEHYRSLCGSQRPSLAAFLAEVPAPKAVAEKFYMLSDGKVNLTASLDKAIYAHGEDIKVTVSIKNDSSKTVKRIKVFVVQHVDVCMFSNGKFKNVVAMMSPKEDCPVQAGTNFEKTYTMMPMKSSTKNWIALEESYNRSGTSLASTVVSVTNPDDRNVFAIYVSYYVKVKITVSLMGGELNLKLPFTLMHTCAEHELAEAVASAALKGTLPELGGAKCVGEVEPETQIGDAKTEGEIKPEKDGT